VNCSSPLDNGIFKNYYRNRTNRSSSKTELSSVDEQGVGEVVAGLLESATTFYLLLSPLIFFLLKISVKIKTIYGGKNE